MPAKQLPPQDYLSQRFRYDPEDGRLYWRACSERNQSWNSRRVGKEAFSINDKGYRRGLLDGTQYYAHRIIWKMIFGEEPSVLDHINGNPLDNRISNLRAGTMADNCRNRRRRKDNKSGSTGVYLDKGRGGRRDRWRAVIGIDGRLVYLGSFETIEDAKMARENAIKESAAFSPRHGF